MPTYTIPTALPERSRLLARIIASLMIIIGALAIVLPVFAGMTAAVALGIAIAVAGVSGLLASRYIRKAGFVHTSGGLYWVFVVVGLLLALMPEVTLGLVAFMLGFFLLLSGVLALQMSKASGVPGMVSRSGPWMTIVLGILVVALGASGAAWLIGIGIGLSLLLQGLRLWQAVGHSAVIIEN